MDIELADYFQQQPRGAMRRMAELLDVPPPMISQWAAKTRPVPPKLAPRIERLTGMQVRRWTLCDDWAEIWEDLVGTPGAPEVRAVKSVSSAGAVRSEGVLA